MKAIVYDGMQKVDYREVSDPKIEKDDDIIVKVTSTAICGSDLHLVHGLVKGMYDGFVLGHETMGIVEEVGKGVRNLKKGDRVIVETEKGIQIGLVSTDVKKINENDFLSPLKKVLRLANDDELKQYKDVLNNPKEFLKFGEANSILILLYYIV